MSTALKERLARSRRRRSSVQSPIGGGDAKKARGSSPDAERNPSTAVLSGTAAAVATGHTERDLPTPCRPKTLNRRQFITSSSPASVAPGQGGMSSLDSAFRVSSSPRAAHAGDSLANASRGSGASLGSLDADSGVELSSSGRAEDSPRITTLATGCPSACDASISSTSVLPSDDVTVLSDDVARSQPCSGSIPSPPSTPVVKAAPSATSFVLYDTPPVSARESSSWRGDVTCAERDALAAELQGHEEQLRKLNLVRLYRSKHHPEQLRELIGKWRQAGQDALLDLHALLPEPRANMSEFLDHMKVDTKLMKYDAEEECFQT